MWRRYVFIAIAQASIPIHRRLLYRERSSVLKQSITYQRTIYISVEYV